MSNVNERFDTAAIENSTDLVALIQRTVHLKQKGRHWEGLCPNHSERTPSFKVTPSKRMWKCYGGCDGFSGVGSISWLMRGEKMSFVDACKMLTDGGLSSVVAASPSYLEPVKNAPMTIMPIPDEALKNRPDTAPGLGMPNQTWTYFDGDGRPLFYEYRFNLLNSDGSPKLKDNGKPAKEFRPLSFTEKGWKFLAVQSPRPLYGLDRIASKPTAHVAIFEGAKCADYAAARSVQVCLSWQGGADGVKHTDWTPLKGKRVTLCRDNDEPGWKTMSWLGDHLAAMGCRVFWAVNPSEWPKGYDVADTGWEAPELAEYLKGAVKFADRGESPYLVAAPVVAATAGPVLSPSELHEEFPPLEMPPVIGIDPDRPDLNIGYIDRANDPFVHLGYSKTGKSGIEYWYYVKHRRVLTSLTPNGMNEMTFCTLAPFSWWMNNYPLKNSKLDRVSIGNMLIMRGDAIGMFDHSKRRGRGVWMDGGRVIIHCGDRLLVDGVVSDLSIRSEFFYEQKPAIVGKLPKPLPLMEANKYLDVCKMMSWESPVMAHLLAGWVVLAPLCGILPWRPHFWIVGPSGSGKSTILRWLAHKMLGNFHVFATGGTTEPGLRARLGDDALPVIVEEMEGNSHIARTNVAKILELVRGMSSNDSGSILKGGAGGGDGSETMLHSMFMFASIQSGLDVQADKRRTTMGVLKKDISADAAKRWKEVTEPAIEALITDPFVAAFQARTFAMASVILKNAKVFGAAVAAHLGSQPMGDQLGPLLAGANSLRSNGLVNFDQAMEIVKLHQWNLEKDVASAKEEAALLDVILDQKIRFSVNGSQNERTVAQLISMAAYPSEAHFVRGDDLKQALEGNGLMVRDGAFWIVCDSEWLRGVLNAPGRVWSFGNIDQLLARVDGAERVSEAVVVASKRHKKVVRIPLGSCGVVPPDGQQGDLFANVDGRDDLPF